jgi:hypothetical protein
MEVHRMDGKLIPVDIATRRLVVQWWLIITGKIQPLTITLINGYFVPIAQSQQQKSTILFSLAQLSALVSKDYRQK